MPYNAGYKTEEDEKNGMKQHPAGVPMPVGAAQVLQPTASSSAGTGGGPVGNFVNFGTWFGLNQQKAGQMANTIAGGVKSQGDAATKQLGQAQDAFNKNVAANTLTYQPPATQAPKAPPSGATTSKAPGLESTNTRGAGAPAAVPGAISASEMQARVAPMAGSKAQAMGKAPVQQNAYQQAQDANDTAKLGSATYQGPKGLSDGPGWAEMFRGAQKAQDAANLTGSEEGRQALVQQTYGGPQGTYGSALDAGLANVAGANQFADLRSQYGNLAQQFTDADAASQAAAGRAAWQTGDAAAQYRDAAAQAQQAAAPGPKPYTIQAAPGVGSSSSIIGATPGGNADFQSQADAAKNANAMHSVAQTYGISDAEAAAAVSGMNAAEYAQWIQGTKEGDPEKYLGKGWFAKHKGGA